MFACLALLSLLPDRLALGNFVLLVSDLLVLLENPDLRDLEASAAKLNDVIFF